MTPRKPDRWERMVQDLEFIRDCGGKETPVCESAEVLKLLRKEHAAVVRMVRSIQKAHIEHMDEWIVLQSILDQLKRRAN